MDVDRDGRMRMEKITAWLYDLYPSLIVTRWSNEGGGNGGYVVLMGKNMHVSRGKIAGPSGRAV